MTSIKEPLQQPIDATKSRRLLVVSCIFTGIVLSVLVVAAYFHTEAQIAWCVQRGFDYEHQSRHIGKLIEGGIVCLDENRRVVAIPK